MNQTSPRMIWREKRICGARVTPIHVPSVFGKHRAHVGFLDLLIEHVPVEVLDGDSPIVLSVQHHLGSFIIGLRFGRVNAANLARRSGGSRMVEQKCREYAGFLGSWCHFSIPIVLDYGVDILFQEIAGR